MNRFVRRAIVTAALVAVPALVGSPALAAAQGASQPTDHRPSSHRSHHGQPHHPRPTGSDNRSDYDRSDYSRPDHTRPTTPASTGPSTAAPATSPANRPATASNADEVEVVRLTNVERAKAGCSALHIDDRLVAAARAHSTDMVKANFFEHTGSNGSDFVSREVAAGYPRNDASAENIAYGYRTPAEVMDGWMHSQGHRENILDCNSAAVGVGLVYTAGGTAYWTQDFGRI